MDLMGSDCVTTLCFAQVWVKRYVVLSLFMDI